MGETDDNPGVEQGELEVSEYDVRESNRRIQKYLDAAISDNTRRAYRADLSDFAEWASSKGRRALPAHPHTVADYLATLAESGEYEGTTLQRRTVAIRHLHRVAGEKNPFEEYGQASQKLKHFVRGLKRELGMNVDKKTPLVAKRMRRIILSLDHEDDVRLARDRAVLLVGLLGALRRSELVGLDVDDIQFQERGMRLHIEESQTDQEQEGAWVGIWRQPVTEMCGVEALEEWLEAGRITGGPIFRGIDRWGNVKEKRLSGYSVALIVKRAAKEAGFDPDDFAGHSLRSGLLVDRAQEHDEEELARHSRHKSRESVREYVDRSGTFRHNVTREMFRPDGFWRAYKWFLDNYQRPGGVVPRGDDGWEWRKGEPYRAGEVLAIRYGDKIEPETLDEATSFLEDLSTVWVKREEYED